MDPEKHATMVEDSECQSSKTKTPDGLNSVDLHVEKRLVAKLDAVVLPLLALSYLLAYMVSICSCSIGIMETHLYLAGP